MAISCIPWNIIALNNVNYGNRWNFGEYILGSNKKIREGKLFFAAFGFLQLLIRITSSATIVVVWRFCPSLSSTVPYIMRPWTMTRWPKQSAQIKYCLGLIFDMWMNCSPLETYFSIESLRPGLNTAMLCQSVLLRYSFPFLYRTFVARENTMTGCSSVPRICGSTPTRPEKNTTISNVLNLRKRLFPRTKRVLT